MDMAPPSTPTDVRQFGVIPCAAPNKAASTTTADSTRPTEYS